MKQRDTVRAAVRLARPWHYWKNALVFVPLFFSGQFFSEPGKLLAALVGFAAMSLTASAVYVLNDLLDAPADRQHPTKCRRPIAAGVVKPLQARVLCAALLVGAAALEAAAACLTAQPVLASLLLAAYLALNLAYSVLGVKNWPVFDVTIVAMCFVVRMLYGAALTDVRVSSWLMLTVLMGSYYMALGKRRNELRDSGEGSRAVLRQYSFAFLDKCMYMFLTLTIAFYSLWSVDGQTNARGAVLTVPVVALIALCYCLDVEGNTDGDPIEVLLHDKRLIVMVAVYVLMMLVSVYAGG